MLCFFSDSFWASLELWTYTSDQTQTNCHIYLNPRWFEGMDSLSAELLLLLHALSLGAKRHTIVDSPCLDNIIEIPSSWRRNSRWRAWAASFRCHKNPWCCWIDTPSFSPWCTGWKSRVNTSSVVSFDSLKQFRKLLFLSLNVPISEWRKLLPNLAPLRVEQRCVSIWLCNCLHSRLQKTFALCFLAQDNLSIPGLLDLSYS